MLTPWQNSLGINKHPRERKQRHLLPPTGGSIRPYSIISLTKMEMCSKLQETTWKNRQPKLRAIDTNCFIPGFSANSNKMLASSKLRIWIEFLFRSFGTDSRILWSIPSQQLTSSQAVVRLSMDQRRGPACEPEWNVSKIPDEKQLGRVIREDKTPIERIKREDRGQVRWGMNNQATKRDWEREKIPLLSSDSGLRHRSRSRRDGWKGLTWNLTRLEPAFN